MMQTTEYSPGPWHVEPLQWDRGASIAICNRQNGVLAVIQPLNDAEDSQSALRDPCDLPNAHLMAAAPELLEALEEALREIEYWHSDMLEPEERAHPGGNGWARVHDRGRAAIAQAKNART